MINLLLAKWIAKKGGIAVLLTVGDLIDISIPITGEDHDNEQDEASTSGLYLITQLRHKIAPQQKQHEISMKVYKDCTKKELYTNRT